MKKLRRRVSAEKVVDTAAAAAAAAGAGQLHVEGQLFVGQHHKTTAGKLGLGKRSKRVVRRSSDTAIRDEVHGWSDLETQRQALESLKKAPVGGGGAAAGGAGAPARRGGPKRGAVRRNTVGDMHDGPRHAAPVPEGLPPPGATPEPQKKGARPKAVRRKSTEGAIADAITQLPSRDSFLFDAPPQMDLSPDSAADDYARLRSGSEVTADELQPDGYAGSSASSDARGSRGQRTGRIEQPAGEGGSAEPVAMRSAAEVDQAVARARERMPSDEWSEEARRTTREVLITIEPVQKKEPARTQLRQPSGGAEPQGGQTKRGRPRKKTEWTPADVSQQPSAAAKQSSVKPTGSPPKQSGSAVDEDSSDSVSDTDSEYEEPADSGGLQLRSWQPPAEGADSQAGLRPAEPAPAGLAFAAGAPPTGLEQTLQMMAERSTKLGKEKRLLGEKVSALEKERAGLLTRLEALEKEKREWEKLKGSLRDLLGAASEKAVGSQ